MVMEGGLAENGHANGVEKKRKAHVLFVSIQYPGHFAPLVQLLYHLEAKYPGITVTVWGNDGRIGDLQKLQRRGELKGLDLRLEITYGEVPPYPDPKFPVRAATTVPSCFKESEPFRMKLLETKGTPEAPTAIVSDMFQYWSKDIAEELSIPWYVYYSTPPAFLVNILEAPALTKVGIHPWTSPNLNDLVGPNFPGLTHVRIRDLTEEIFAFHEFYHEVLERVKTSAAILLNSSESLECESGTLSALRKKLPHTRLLPVGPSLQYPGFGYIYSPAQSSSNCLQWLGTRPEKSVLYVAFGSLGSVPKALVYELAVGLEASGLPFLWALKKSPKESLEEWLPEGFEERTRDRGIIETGWAPQSRILAHCSTGGFLSHCGWNSSLESICAGIPIVAWPLSAEQFMNARFIADVAHTGLAICYYKEEDENSFDDITRREVEMAVRDLMVEERGREIKENALELQRQVAEAVSKGGSSYENMNLVVDELAGVTSS